MDELSTTKILQEAKTKMDAAYDITRRKYNIATANLAIKKLLIEFNTSSFTRDGYARFNMDEFLKDQFLLDHLLMDYAISSCIASEKKITLSSKELIAYANDDNGELNYDEEHAVEVFAVAVASNPFWAYNLMALNSKLKEAVVYSFIKERYLEGKKIKLDSGERVKLIRLSDTQEILQMNKDFLDRCIQTMINDESLGGR